MNLGARENHRRKNFTRLAPHLRLARSINVGTGDEQHERFIPIGPKSYGLLEPKLGIYLFAAELEPRPVRHKKRTSQTVNH